GVAAQALPGAPTPVADAWSAVAGVDAVYAAAPIALVLVVLAAAAWVLAERGRPARKAPTWTCGISPEPAFQYTATSYAKLIRLYYGPILRTSREIEVEHHPATPYPRTVRYDGRVCHVIDERLYRPAHLAAVRASELARRLQSGSL